MKPDEYLVYSQEEFDHRADLHQKWLRRISLLGAGPCVRMVIRQASFGGASLYGANLADAHMQDCIFAGAANIMDINFAGADLSHSNFSGCALYGVNFCNAVLRGANFEGADLRYANFLHADLADASGLDSARLPQFQLCPSDGDFIGYKKLADGLIATLQIPASAHRTSTLVGRKCRAEFARVLAITADGTPCKNGQSMHGRVGWRTEYRVGELVYPDTYDPDIRVECTGGIHFFITRREAEEYV